MVARCVSALALLLLTSTLAAAQDRPRIYLGASSKTLGYSPFWVGVKRGFFEQQGLDVQLILLRGVPMTLQALAASSLQIGSGGPEPYIEASERGLDFAIDGEPNIEGMRHNLRVYAEQSGSKGPSPDARKYIDLSYLTEALKELPRR